MARVKPDGISVGGRTVAPSRVVELEAENAALRKRLEMTAPMTLTTWESSGTPHLRAEMAARALYQEWLSGTRAMKLLGFNQKDASDEKLQERILRTPEVTAILLSTLEPPKELKKKIMERCAENAILGSEETSIRATAQLAKLAGWIKPDAGPNVTVSLVSLMNPGATQEKQVQEIASDDVLSILSHEPGEPVRIATGDKAVERALAESQE